MKKLIINADDFGRHQSINNAIIQGHVSGCITSASIMPGGNAFKDAVDKAIEHPQLGIGIHLTLIGEKPVMDPNEIPTLVDDKGYLLKEYPQFLNRFLRGKINLSEVRAELSAQIDKVVASGVRITHIDSHQHLHVLPGIIDIVLDIAEKNNIKSLRIPNVPLGFTGGYSYSFGQFVGRAGLVFLATIARFKAKRREFRIPDHFFGIVAGGSLREDCLLDITNSLKNGTTEVMVHPGDDDVLLGSECGWQHNFQEELAAVLSPKVRKLLESKEIELATFNDIQQK